MGRYLRDLGWPSIAQTGGELNIVEGEDMGMRSLLTVAAIPVETGAPIRVSGAVRMMGKAD